MIHTPTTSLSPFNPESHTFDRASPHFIHRQHRPLDRSTSSTGTLQRRRVYLLSYGTRARLALLDCVMLFDSRQNSDRRPESTTLRLRITQYSDLSRNTLDKASSAPSSGLGIGASTVEQLHSAMSAAASYGTESVLAPNTHLRFFHYKHLYPSQIPSSLCLVQFCRHLRIYLIR